ncbi:MAG: hypothetical protein P8Y70_21065, partial [Candidatus Lokiarchaeota archaeon]
KKIIGNNSVYLLMNQKLSSINSTLQGIRDKIQNNEIDKEKAVRIVTSIILNSMDDLSRINSLHILRELAPYDNKIYLILENLATSDLNGNIRSISFQIIGENFGSNSIILLNWALVHEKNIQCLIEVIKALTRINNKESREILIEYLKKIISKKDPFSKTEKYINAIKALFKNHKLEFLSTSQISDIILNYIIISNLIDKFYYVHYELNRDSCLIHELDLSDIEYEVRGWKSEFKNEIKNLSEIIGLRYLKELKSLDLSNNMVEDVEDLTHLQKLENLILTNNSLKNPINIEYFKKLPHLRYLALVGNLLVKYLHKEDFNQNLTLKIAKYSYFQ